MRVLFVFMLWSNIITSQSYFQQEVNYTIKVRLDDKTNYLHAYEEFEYINNSSDELSFIYVHLWPNAYKDNTTAMSRQLLRDGNKVMENNTDADKGFIDSLDFKVNGEKVKFKYHEHHKDIAKLILITPLKPGGKMIVSTPFRVKIPNGNISRLGHVGESFQITQWYPKPAVYDKEGWHHMPYLTQGEFYSEYGSFDVSITLPSNYVVGATGDLQTDSEKEFLEKKAKNTQNKIKNNFFVKKKFPKSNFPKSSDKLKTIRFTQTKIHDFGWFADKRYEVLKGEVKLPNSGKKVTTWLMFTPKNAHLWKNAIEYINDGIYWYSKWNGDYPYSQATAVDGTISAGGGMEYPNVTVIGNTQSASDLELVIVHEIGHNWFYSILGSNERVHPWMDEGINTANEIRYFKNKYPENVKFSENFGGIADRLHIGNISHQGGNEITYKLTSTYGKDQPIELHSNEYTSINYGAIVYAKTGLMFTYLNDYLGDEMYDKCLQAYFEKWKFKHPQPADLKSVMESTSGQDLSWFFKGIITNNSYLDYKLKRVKKDKNGNYKITVKNKGSVKVPVRVDAYKDNKIIESIWLKPDSNTKKATGSFNSKGIDKVVLDGNKNMPEMNRMNNSWEKSRLLNKVEPVNFEFLFGDNDPTKNTVWWTPVIGMNTYDKFMFGVAFHNFSLPQNKLEFFLSPMYSFGANRITGIGNVHYNIVPEKHIKRIEIGVKGQSFSSGFLSQGYSYFTVKPFIYFDLGKLKERKAHTHSIEIKGVKTNGVSNESNLKIENAYGAILDYKLQYKKSKYILDLDCRVDYLNDVNALFQNSNTSITLTNTFIYKIKREKEVELRVFAGRNIYSNNILASGQQRVGFSIGGQSGYQDYFYEHLMFGRNESNGLFAQQRIENQGGFKTVSNLGFSSDFLTSANLFVELPYIPFFGVYADYGMYQYNKKMYSVADFGVGIRLKKIVSVYFPIVQTNNLNNSLSTFNYGQTIRVSINLNAYNYRALIDLF